MKAHALLSASSAHRWLACTAAPGLERVSPQETPSIHAQEGTLAHEISELKLRKAYIEPSMTTRKFNSEMKKLKAHELYQPEMDGYTDAYVDYIAGVIHSYDSPPHIAVEKRLDYSNIAPGGFGTGDCIIIGGGVMHVIDFKYGKGVQVSAKSNPQLMLYGIGALNAYDFLYGVQNVKLHVVQPRVPDTYSVWGCSVQELYSWGENEVKPRALEAHEGRGNYCVGEHCRFCRAKGVCRAYGEYNLKLANYKKSPPQTFSNWEIGEILTQAQELSTWVKAIEDYALAETLAGREIPGWKAVEGRSKREFFNSDAAFETVIASGIDPAMLYERKPLSLAGVEKLLGKPKFQELLANHVNFPPGKPTLVSESDKREPYKQPSAEEDFAIAIGG